MDENKRIVEIDGIKIEVDLRNAKVVETYHVGDPVMVLHKAEQYKEAVINAGVIVSFNEFNGTPAIQIMELTMNNYSDDVGFKIVSIVSGETTKKDGGISIAPYSRYEGLISKTSVVTKLNRKIAQKEMELEELDIQKEYFIKEFSKSFAQIVGTTNGND